MYSILLVQVCDLVAPLVLILRTSMRRALLSGYIYPVIRLHISSYIYPVIYIRLSGYIYLVICIRLYISGYIYLAIYIWLHISGYIYISGYTIWLYILEIQTVLILLISFSSQ